MLLERPNPKIISEILFPKARNINLAVLKAAAAAFSISGEALYTIINFVSSQYILPSAIFQFFEKLS